ncbi:hypothetical protein ACFE04_015383 [Oxalis oulophora]
MTRRCSHCSMNGHNSRTCPNRGVKLFGVRLTDGSSSSSSSSIIRKSVSMGNLTGLGSGQLGLNSPGDDGTSHDAGYASEDFVAGSSNSRERKKGTPWTEEEHRMFLSGLQKLGKGDWRGISRNYVFSRTPTQVASHAQKYFIRQSNMSRRKRRTSLFDIVACESTDTPVFPPEFLLGSHSQVDAQSTNPLPAHPAMQEECESMDSTHHSNQGEPQPQPQPPNPDIMQSHYPVVYPGYFAPFFPFSFPFWPGYSTTAANNNKEEMHHEVVRPTAVHSKKPINIDQLVGMSELSLGEPNKNAELAPPSLSLKGSSRQSAFHANPVTGGSSMKTSSSPIHAALILAGIYLNLLTISMCLLHCPSSDHSNLSFVDMKKILVTQSKAVLPKSIEALSMKNKEHDPVKLVKNTLTDSPPPPPPPPKESLHTSPDLKAARPTKHDKHKQHKTPKTMDLNNGFSNQLLEFKNAILISSILNRTLILPPILDHHAVVLGSCPKFRVFGANEIRVSVWDHAIHLLRTGRYVSIADVIDISSLVSSSSIRVLDFRIFVSLWCGVDIKLACSAGENAQSSLFDSLKQCGSRLSGLDGNIGKCLYPVDDDCRTTVWTYKNGEDGVLDSFQPDEEFKKKKKILYVRIRRDVYKTLGPGSKAESAMVLAFGSLFTSPYKGSESYIDIHESQKDQKINSLIQKVEFLPFVPEIITAGKKFATETIKAPFLCAQLRLLDGQFKNHRKATFLGLREKLESLTGRGPIHIFVMTDLPEGNWTGTYLEDLARDSNKFKLYFLSEHDELVKQTMNNLAEAGHGLKFGSVPMSVDRVDEIKKQCTPRELSDVLLFIEETVCSCASLGFVGTAGSTIAETIALMRKVAICSSQSQNSP